MRAKQWIPGSLVVSSLLPPNIINKSLGTYTCMYAPLISHYHGEYKIMHPSNHIMCLLSKINLLVIVESK